MEETHCPTECVCVCVCVCVLEGKRGTGRGNMGNRSREGVRWICAPAPSLLSPIYALQGDTGWGFQGDCLGLVMDLQVGGTLYVIFSPSVGPYTIHSPSPPSFHSRLHNHCTAHKGLSSQVQPRLARIKERFQLKMFFPSLFFFPSTSSFPLRSCFPFSSHNSLFQSYLLLTFHSCFLHTGLFPSHFILFSVKAGKNKSV